MKAQRVVWGETLTRLAGSDPRILVLDGDLATSTRADMVAEGAPDAFIQLGIAEQNIVGVAVGLSTLGYRPWLSTFGVFLTHRALDQIRMLVSQMKAPVRLAAAYSGLLNGASGKTHQDIEDFAVMRAMPNMTVIAPADEHEAKAVIEWAVNYESPVYIRFARDAVDPVFSPSHQFELGAPVTLREGGPLTLLSTGVQTSRTASAADLLADQGVDVTHVHLATLKPVQEDALLNVLGRSSHVITVEEHSRIGGLGGLAAELLSERSTARVTRIGLADAWSESGPNDFLLDKYGLSPERVRDQVLQIVKETDSRAAS